MRYYDLTQARHEHFTWPGVIECGGTSSLFLAALRLGTLSRARRHGLGMLGYLDCWTLRETDTVDYVLVPDGIRCKIEIPARWYEMSESTPALVTFAVPQRFAKTDQIEPVSWLGSQQLAAESHHSPGTPFKQWIPLSSKVIPDPA